MITFDMKKRKYIKLFGILLLFAAGSLFLALASPLNPWSKQYPDIDSSIFIYFGMGMRKGFVPYRDMFDHKGPFLWVIQWLGLTIGNGNMAGIWFLEWFCLIFDAWFLYQCAKLFTKNDLIAVIAAGLSLEPLIHYLEDGNYGEEWALPFIIFSLYVFLRYCKIGVFRLWQVFLTGVCLGCVLGIRVNMVAVWAVFLPFIFIRLIWLKQWKVLRECCIAFIGGLCAAILPFILYYAVVGELGNMWYAHITYNLLYCKDSGGAPEAKKFIKATLGVGWIVTIPIAFLMVYLVIKNLRMRRFSWEWCIPIFYIVTLVMASVGGRNFPHYAIVMIPCLTIPLAVLLDFAGMKMPGRVWTLTIILGAIGMLTIKGDIRKQINFIEANWSEDYNDEELISYIKTHSEETDPILVMSLNAKYYITTDRFADTKYFIQHYMYDNDRSLYRKMLKYIEETPPKLIIMRVYNVDGEPWGEWMTAFHEEMLHKVEQGSYGYYVNGFFVAFDRKD